ncbi:endoplasmic reticulum membrane-associated RNA degradation protein-like [Dreissena polymorpha]|uniref:endoplasmic reticulum membrane-associated RNA degradation protein-like n=1 Tax=Dreissena polymorpha TaxID=45954 RepID=UPI002264C393|nr:endoplasmic reticulum membrane-associated RNA degradation protein-like [Dreissena polymorpha]
MKWTGQEQTLQQVWLDVFEGDDEERPVDELTALLVTCAILERGLGDVYVFTAKSQSPSMLKDILSSKALEEFLGSDVMKVLQLFLGPPSSLNLRNVAWHGFPYPGEIPFRCILFLLVVIPSVGHILQRKLGEGQITHREPVMFPHTRHISELKVLQDGDEICQIWDTRLVSWDTHLFWNKVQKLFGKQRHSECCALLLYYLEQGLRAVYTSVNDCQSRLLTAEATALYTTLDEILNPYLPNKSANKIERVLGHQFLEMILDHVSYAKGPRVRDHLSHGEASWQEFPGELVDNIATICFVISAMFHKQSAKSVVPDGKLCQLWSDVQSYKVQFHRISIIECQICDVFKSLSDTERAVTTNPDLTERNGALNIAEEASSLIQRCKDLVLLVERHWPDHKLANCFDFNTFGKCCHILETDFCLKTKTLFRECKEHANMESEVLSHLDHVVEECLVVVQNVQAFVCSRQQQMQAKLLRSRQRENYRKFLIWCPTFCVCAATCSYLCLWQLDTLDSLHTEPAVKEKKHFLRFWKTVLQFCENLRVYSSPDRNKWVEGADLITQIIDFLKANIQPIVLCLCDDVANKLSWYL